MEGPTTQIVVLVSMWLAASGFAALNNTLANVGEGRLKALLDDDVLKPTAARLLRDRSIMHVRLIVGRVLSWGVAAIALVRLLQIHVSGLWLWVVAPAMLAIVDGGLNALFSRALRPILITHAIEVFRWIRPVEWGLAPVVAPVLLVKRTVDRLISRERVDLVDNVTEFDVERMINRGEQSGTLSELHAEMLRSVLEFQDTVTREVMVPRTHVVALDVHTSVQKALELVVDKGHSRYPVFRDTVDHIEGLLYAKDLFKFFKDDASSDKDISALVRRPAYYVPESKKVSSLLREMQVRRFHMAVVIDEFGGTAGIVTLEDIIEEIVGEIRDEHDKEDVPVKMLRPGVYTAKASVSIYDLEDILDVEIPKSNGDYDSLGGMITEVAGRVPKIGESVEIGGLKLTIREADKKHVVRVEIRKSVPQSASLS